MCVCPLCLRVILLLYTKVPKTKKYLLQKDSLRKRNQNWHQLIWHKNTKKGESHTRAVHGQKVAQMAQPSQFPNAMDGLECYCARYVHTSRYTANPRNSDSYIQFEKSKKQKRSGSKFSNGLLLCFLIVQKTFIFLSQTGFCLEVGSFVMGGNFNKDIQRRQHEIGKARTKKQFRRGRLTWSL